MNPSGVLLLRRAIAAVAALASTSVLANPKPWGLNMPRGASEIAERVWAVHMLVFWVCVVIGVIVFAAMFYAMFKFRKSKGAVAEKWSHNLLMETVWTTVPVIILIVMAWPATRLLVDMADVAESDMTVKITGYQWRWRYEYVNYFDQPSKVNFISSLDAESHRVRMRNSGLDPRSVKDEEGFDSYLLNVDRPLVLPVGVKVRFVITADDVIHSWWVPTLGWKKDAVPGMINSSWTQIDQPGIYRGQCAELCGKDHAYMPIVVKAVPKAEFEQWLAAEESEIAARAAATAQLSPTPSIQG